MTPNNFAIFVLFAWPLAMVVLAMIIPVRRVVLVSILGGNLFLPATGIALSGLPNYTKLLAAGLGALIPAFLFAFSDLIKFRPKLLDLFFIGFLVAPGISSILNGLGPYDAVTTVANRFLEWGVPYWIGRTLFIDLPALRDVCVAVVVSALAYAPLCIYEMVMSPQLSMKIYGFRPSAFSMTYRMGGWRPMVFMQHGLALGAWMAAAALVAWVLWRSRAIRAIWGIPISWIAIFLILVTIGLRSTGAAVL
ncbi:MAG: O-antigen ligase domain-containing protein, partial [Phycisphaerales bacterium]